MLFFKCSESATALSAKIDSFAEAANQEKRVQQQAARRVSRRRRHLPIAYFQEN